MNDSYQRAKELFLEAVELPEEEREAFLEKECAGDTDLIERVRALIAADRDDDSLLDQDAAALLSYDAEETVASEPDGTPTEIGPYRLLRKIGEGGMGEVWLAEQTRPVRRKVALKIIKRGMDTKQVVARFEVERQALALMEHPCIAKVFDAGETPRGRPYFVMEYVQGVPITEHCDRQRLTNRERLDLFVLVCEGVQHAHHKAVIHRDLKPSNVLVAIHDDKPLPKIIDFGVAKATGQKLTDLSMHTQLGMLIGTPAYMSPEQAEMTGQEVDTRADVYALGVMLYELLVGALPFDVKELHQAGLEAMVRKIREDEPPRPSARLTTLGEQSTESAKRRNTELPALKRELSGDLDWITLKAMAKERTRRYDSPRELAADIERYLTDEPVLATPPSAIYRAKKFVKRHTVGVTAAAVAVLALVVFAVTMTVQAGRIAAERDRANHEAEAKGQVSDFMKNLFAVSDPSEARGNSITARELLDAGAAKIEQLEDERTRTELMETIGDVYRNLGLYPEAEKLLQQALDDRRRLLGDEHPETLASLNSLGFLYWKQARYDEAEQLYLEALETGRRVLGDEHPQVLHTMNNLGIVYRNQFRSDEAEAIYLETLSIRRRLLGDDDPETLATQMNLGNIYSRKGDYDEAEQIYLKVLEAERRVLGEDHPGTFPTAVNLAIVYREQGRLDESETLFRETLERQRRVLGEDHPEALRSMNILGLVWLDQERYEDARTLYIENVESRKRVLGDDHPDTLLSMGNLALAYMKLERFDDAESLYLETLETQERTLGEGHPNTAVSLYNLARLYRDTDRFAESGEYFERTLKVDEQALGPDHPYVADDLEEYAKLRRKMGDAAGAAELEARVKAIRDE